MLCFRFSETKRQLFINTVFEPLASSVRTYTRAPTHVHTHARTDTSLHPTSRARTSSNAHMTSTPRGPRKGSAWCKWVATATARGVCHSSSSTLTRVCWCAGSLPWWVRVPLRSTRNRTYTCRRVCGPKMKQRVCRLLQYFSLTPIFLPLSASTTQSITMA